MMLCKQIANKENNNVKKCNFTKLSVHELKKYEIPFLLRIIKKSVMGMSSYSNEVKEAIIKYHNFSRIWNEHKNNYYILVVKDGRNFVATGTIGQDGYIKRMYVDPKYQASGAGKTLIKNLEAYAIQNNIQKITLEALMGSLPFYHRNGYNFRNEERCTIPGTNIELSYTPGFKNIISNLENALDA